MDGKSVGEPTQVVSKVKLSTKVENTGHWLVEDHAQIWEVLKTEESSIQDWGEEVEEGAVYHVTLKRVQIQQAANKGARWLGVEGDQLPPGHTVSQYETCKIRTIKAGTLEKLVENLLTAFGDNDFTYISIFLSTYRGFASTKEVLELLLDRYGNLTGPNCEEDGSSSSSESKAVIRKLLQVAPACGVPHLTLVSRASKVSWLNESVSSCQEFCFHGLQIQTFATQ